MVPSRSGQDSVNEGVCHRRQAPKLKKPERSLSDINLRKLANGEEELSCDGNSTTASAKKRPLSRKRFSSDSVLFDPGRNAQVLELCSFSETDSGKFLSALERTTKKGSLVERTNSHENTLKNINETKLARKREKVFKDSEQQASNGSSNSDSNSNPKQVTTESNASYTKNVKKGTRKRNGSPSSFGNSAKGNTAKSSSVDAEKSKNSPAQTDEKITLANSKKPDSGSDGLHFENFEEKHVKRQGKEIEKIENIERIAPVKKRNKPTCLDASKDSVGEQTSPHLDWLTLFCWLTLELVNNNDLENGGLEESDGIENQRIEEISASLLNEAKIHLRKIFSQCGIVESIAPYGSKSFCCEEGDSEKPGADSRVSMIQFKVTMNRVSEAARVAELWDGTRHSVGLSNIRILRLSISWGYSTDQPAKGSALIQDALMSRRTVRVELQDGFESVDPSVVEEDMLFRFGSCGSIKLIKCFFEPTPTPRRGAYILFESASSAAKAVEDAAYRGATLASGMRYGSVFIIENSVELTLKGVYETDSDTCVDQGLKQALDSNRKG